MLNWYKQKKIPYAAAPSHYALCPEYVTVLTPIKKHFGYMGVLLIDSKSEEVECHICGGWFKTLGNHITSSHQMTAVQYKEQFGLSNKFPLHGPKYSAVLVKANREKGKFKNLRSFKGGKWANSKKRNKKIRKTMKENRFQVQLIKGVTRDQLVARLKEEYKKLGHTPHTKKLSFYDAIMSVFGTYEAACKAAGIPYNDPAEKLKEAQDTARKNGEWRKKLKRGEIKYTTEQIVDFVLKFKKEHGGRKPTSKEFRIGLGESQPTNEIQSRNKK